MEKVYFSKSTLGFYMQGIHKSMPHDVKPVDMDKYLLLVNNTEAGMKLSSNDDGDPILVDIIDDIAEAQVAERIWRNSELQRADIELYKVQDSDQNGKGTVGQWREYRKALRAWPEDQNFPNKQFRPVAPY